MQDGDNIIAVAGKPVKKVNSIGSEIIMNEAKTSLTVLRNGPAVELAIPAGFISSLSKNRLTGFYGVRYPHDHRFSVLPAVKVLEGNVQKGDTLIGVDGHPIQYATDLGRDTSLIISCRPRSETPMTFRRGHDTVQAVVARQEKIGTGIRYKSPEDILGYVQINYTLLQAVPAGIHKSIRDTRQLYPQPEAVVHVQGSEGPG
jgi:regulator of sigma E protease